MSQMTHSSLSILEVCARETGMVITMDGMPASHHLVILAAVAAVAMTAEAEMMEEVVLLHHLIRAALVQTHALLQIHCRLIILSVIL